MKNPFLTIREKRRKLELFWVSRTFAGPNTFRFLRGINADRVRELMRGIIGYGVILSQASSQKSYDLELKRLIRKLEKRASLPFGHASKLVNLYVKELISRPGMLSPAETKRMQKWAHVPIDRVILQRLREHFSGEPAVRNVPLGISLKALSTSQYMQLQEMLRIAAKQARMHPIDYDLWWSGPTPKHAARQR